MYYSGQGKTYCEWPQYHSKWVCNFTKCLMKLVKQILTYLPFHSNHCFFQSWPVWHQFDFNLFSSSGVIELNLSLRVKYSKWPQQACPLSTSLPQCACTEWALICKVNEVTTCKSLPLDWQTRTELIWIQLLLDNYLTFYFDKMSLF